MNCPTCGEPNREGKLRCAACDEPLRPPRPLLRPKPKIAWAGGVLAILIGLYLVLRVVEIRSGVDRVPIVEETLADDPRPERAFLSHRG